MEKTKHARTSTGKNEEDLYKKVVEYEEKEAKTRDVIVDAELFDKTSTHVKLLLKEIYKSKISHFELSEIIKNERKACMHVAVLKKLNRLLNINLAASRDAISVEKQKVESKYMQYQNLLYEVDHYNSEFRKCMQYKSRDEDITLVSTKEFLEYAPNAEKFKGDIVDTHELYLARLEYELQQRIDLDLLLEELHKEKKHIKEEIVRGKEKLEEMEPKLLQVVTAAKPLQEYLGLSTDEIIPEQKLASHLPDPLYLMYRNIDAFRQFIGEGNLSISVKGTLEELEQFKEAQKELENKDKQEQDSQEESSGKKHRRRKVQEVDREQEKKKQMVQKHPLSIQVVLTNENITLKLHFYYLSQLRIITVVSATDGQGDMFQKSNCAREVLTGESILSQLYVGDTGIESPNLVNQFQLRQIGIDSFHSLIPQVGYAYTWAQKLCGLEFLNLQNFEVRLLKQDSAFSHFVEEIFNAINNRMKARASLALQLTQLEQNIIPKIPDYITHPKSSSSTLTKFQSVSYQRFCKDVINSNSVADFAACDDLFYLAVICRPKATLNAWIIIKSDYPNVVPMFILNLMYNGEFHNGNSDNIRDMERKVNLEWDSLAEGKDLSGWLLAAQLNYLCAFLDIYLETELNSKFSISAVYFRSVAGRNRGRPFKYHKTGNGIFAQF